MKSIRLLVALISAVVLAKIATVAAAAQALDRPLVPQGAASQSEGIEIVGRTADSAVGEVGQRQEREPIQGNPQLRTVTRIQNRIETRLNNRIDRNYAPTTSGTAAFERAADAGKLTSAPGPR